MLERIGRFFGFGQGQRDEDGCSFSDRESHTWADRLCQSNQVGIVGYMLEHQGNGNFYVHDDIDEEDPGFRFRV
jgi:hypothetical protein